MKIQNLAVIFIIIILPISLILTSYVQNQAKTISLQIDYDTRLNNATYDALKAFQLNTINSDSSDIANSKLRDINASVNSFFNSIASNFNMAGYNKDVLKDYVPALVYTMYDGYYIYSPFTNTLDDTNEVRDTYDNIVKKSDAETLKSETDGTYWEGERVSGVKPYIYYSCRYKRDNDDFVITYSLDNYITIQGIINGKSVFDYGYLLDNVDTTSGVKYRGVEIKGAETDGKERLEEYIVDSEVSVPTKYTYVKINGVKYYKDDYNPEDKWFSILNGTRYYTDEKFTETTKAGQEYYKKAKEFTEKVYGTGSNDYNLGTLKGSDAVEINVSGVSKPIYEKDNNGNEIIGNYKLGDYYIFEHNNKISIEDPESNFNQHRLAVIRYAIEKNLSIAIANYNHYSETNIADFRMPELKEDEWDKILNNISIISFLQGLNIGGKVYNGYSIITNNKNKEVVNEDSIYITTTDGEYHRPNEIGLQDNIEQGVLNIDFEIKSSINNAGNIIYYNPKQKNNNPYTGSYSSIVNQTGVDTTDNLYKYMANKRTDLLQRHILQHLVEKNIVCIKQIII